MLRSWLFAAIAGALVIVAGLIIGQYAVQAVSRPPDEIRPQAGGGLVAPERIRASEVVTYYSSVDGAALPYLEYLPANYDPTRSYPLAIMLHWGGADMYAYDTAEWRGAADRHGYVLAMPQGRRMPNGSYNTYYFNGALGPGEQDMLDVIDAVASRHLIDRERVYISGFSLGGLGSWGIAARNPGIFAAVASGAPYSDAFQNWDYGESNSPPPNTATHCGGLYGQSPITDTNWYMISPRFLLPNLMHTPVRLVHGTLDFVMPNSTVFWPYMQSRSVTDRPGWSDQRGKATTLPELQAVWPGRYVHTYTWPSALHLPGIMTAESTLSFFNGKRLVTNPDAVAFTTYEDRHTRAYWLRMDLVNPWTAQPGLVYATRYPDTNSVQLQVTGTMTLTLDMAPMGLTSSKPLTLTVLPANRTAPATEVAVVLSGTWPSGPGWAYRVTRNGVILSRAEYEVLPDRLILLRRASAGAALYVVTAARVEAPAGPDVSTGFTTR